MPGQGLRQDSLRLLSLSVVRTLNQYPPSILSHLGGWWPQFLVGCCPETAKLLTGFYTKSPAPSLGDGSPAFGESLRGAGAAQQEASQASHGGWAVWGGAPRPAGAAFSPELARALLGPALPPLLRKPCIFVRLRLVLESTGPLHRAV